MPWLDFANHFLSNQSLHAWSWINRTFSWEWCFLVGTLALSVLDLFLFCFCSVWGEQATDAQDYGWQSKGEDHFRSWFPFFFVYLVVTLYLFRCYLVQRPFCFLSILDREFSFLSFLLSLNLWLRIFSFCFLPILWSRTFFSSFLFFSFFFFWGKGLWWVGILAQCL